MVVRARIQRSSYHDSVALLQAQRALRELPGVQEAGVVMATPANLELLRQAGLWVQELEGTGPDDLVAAVRAVDAAAADAALRQLDALLSRREAASGADYRPRSVRTAAAQLGGADLALVSVPGRFAAAVAEEALREGLHVMLFSDNVPLEDEVRLKALAGQRGLLLMGPDCGTAIVAGAGLGFANRVRRGPVGIVAASGTGLQEVASRVHRAGGGVSCAVGTGGRDLSDRVGGQTFALGLAALAEDPATEVVVLLSKPPSPRVADRLVGMARACGKPVVVNFLGARPPDRADGVHFAETLQEAADLALRLCGLEPPEEETPEPQARLLPGQRWVRGLFAGGTLCAEAQVVLSGRLGRVWSNAPVCPDAALPPGGASREHTALDLGADEYTVGRLHPMLDPSVRDLRLRQEVEDPEVAVVLVDLVLGYGAHPDPASELVRAVRAAQDRLRTAGREVVFLASVCGTDLDPQGYQAQVATLREAGVWVAGSNAQAARAAARVAEAAGGGRAPAELPRLEVPEETAPLPPVPEAVRRVLAGGLRVVNVGLSVFEESLRAQGVPVVSVDWRPPAGGDAEMMELLSRLGG